MTTYKEIFGKQIKQLSTDPTDAGAEGQIWFNTTSGTFKTVLASGAWSSGAPMIRTTTTAGANHALGVGIQTAAIYAGGYSPYTNKTEHYNGIGWSSGGNMNLTRVTSGFGTSTAAVAAGGITFPGTVGNQAEEYNGTAWTTGNALGTSRAYGTGSGILTAGIFFGGSTDGGDTNTVGNTEEYDGTSWSEQNDLNSARKMLGAAGKGSQTAALAFGGDIAPITGNTETYDGTSWTEVNNLNTARENLGGAGDQTSALAFGGGPAGATATESWDGTNWSTSPATLANGRQSQPTIGTSTSALMVGGGHPSFPGGWVEEYNFTVNTITPGAWASGGNLNQQRRIQGNVGGKDAGLTFGGYTSSPNHLNASEEYDGTSWTEGNNLNTGRYGLRGFGIQTAAVAIGGQKSGTPTAIANYESYDGSSWTASGNMNVAREEPGGFGIQTAGVACKGFNGPSYTNVLTSTEEYNGSSWTSGNAASVGASSVASAGTLTAGVVAGGSTPSAKTTSTEEYDGTNWTTGGAMIIGLSNAAPSKNGTQGEWQVAGGRTAAGIIGNTFVYNGSSWITGPSIATARTEFDGGGTAGSHLICGGSTPAPAGVTTTEEFTGETTAVNVKTLTSS